MDGKDNKAYQDDGNSDPSLRNRSIQSNGGGEKEKQPSTDDSPCVEMENTIQMKKQVGLVSGVAIIVGTMIGSGIFISPKGVLNGTGSVGASLMVWAGCGILAMLGALSYAELGTMIPKSGGEYPYLYEGMGPVAAYLYSWISITVLKTSSYAIICLAFADYVSAPIFDDCGPPEIVTKLLAVAAIITISIVNCYSVKLAARVQVFFTAVKILALVAIIIGGIVKLAQGNTVYLLEGFKDTTPDASKFALAFYSGLWAYDGWNNLNYITEELINPYVNLPRCIFIGLPMVTILYVLTIISYLTVMSKEEILASSAVAVTWGNRVLGDAAIFIPIAVACSTFGAANGSCFTAGRISYVASREGHLPGFLSYVHVKQYTPITALILNTLLALLMIIPSDIETLIDFFSFTAWLFYGATAASLLILRYTRKDAKRPYKVPIVIPIFVLLASIYLVVAPIVQDPQIQFLYAILFVAGGLVFYIPFVYFKLRFKFVDSFAMGVQLFLEVAPSSYYETD